MKVRITSVFWPQSFSAGQKGEVTVLVDLGSLGKVKMPGLTVMCYGPSYRPAYEITNGFNNMRDSFQDLLDKVLEIGYEGDPGMLEREVNSAINAHFSSEDHGVKYLTMEIHKKTPKAMRAGDTAFANFSLDLKNGKKVMVENLPLRCVIDVNTQLTVKIEGGMRGAGVKQIVTALREQDSQIDIGDLVENMEQKFTDVLIPVPEHTKA